MSNFLFGRGAPFVIAAGKYTSKVRNKHEMDLLNFVLTMPKGNIKQIDSNLHLNFKLILAFV